MSNLVGNPVPLIGKNNGFPLPVSVNIMRVVAKAINYAWDEICKDPTKHLVPKSPSAPEEDIYTDAICNMLNQLLQGSDEPVPGFTGATFDTVCRGDHLPNYCGVALNKQPDLVIRLSNSPPYATRLVGVFIESKVVCMTKSVSDYTTDGLMRFVRGDYGWAMQAGMMLAYQKPKYRCISQLETQLELQQDLCCLKKDGRFLSQKPGAHPLSALSVHQRKWTYKDGGEAGDIHIWHMWDLITP